MKKFEKKTVYIYEINGKEKITITSAEEASRWDAIFEIAEHLDTLMQETPPEVKLDEAQRTDLCIYLAQNRDAVLKALGDAATAAQGDPATAAPAKEPAADTATEKPQATPESGVKKQSFVQEFKRPVPPSKDGFSL